ncbi:family 43 glycosylhydrolase [Wenyingzhuangia sp. IMCC45467]
MNYLKKYASLGAVCFAVALLFSCKNQQVVEVKNPMVKGDFADPSIVKFQGKYYIYATKDPWGGTDLAVMESSDFKNWEQKTINWPTKQACTSATSNDSNVWAPSVIQANNGKFYMYVSVGSEVWVGVSEHPLGPWKNAKSDNTPLIKGDMFPEYHMIDAEVFIDDDGQAYLYWGSGLKWVNGHCFVVKLAEDMISFNADEIQDITPPNYFEAPIMLKKEGVYYLMYSDGKCTNETYKVRYATGTTPYGPWKEGKESPVLTTSPDKSTMGPGHHTVFNQSGQTYILYHRIQKNNNKDHSDLLRELAIDSLNFNEQGGIDKVRLNGVKISL